MHGQFISFDAPTFMIWKCNYGPLNV